MNGYPTRNPPTTCEFCGNPFLLSQDGSHLKAFRTSSGKLYCNEFCADAEDEESWKNHRRQA